MVSVKSGESMGSIVLPLSEDKQYILNDAYMRSFELEMRSPAISTPSFGEGYIACGLMEITLDMSITASTATLIIGGPFNKRVRNKQVVDCSVAELLFAIRKMIN